MTSTTILMGLLASALSGISGYMLSFRFYCSEYTATDKSGDFGSPRGGIFALMAGVVIGMTVFSLLGKFGSITPDSVGTGVIISMIVGAVAGVVGKIRGAKSRFKFERNTKC